MNLIEEQKQNLINIIESVEKGNKPKTFADTFLYNKGNYHNYIFKFLMETERLDKSHPSFQDLIADIKRRNTSSYVLKVLESTKTILCINHTPLPRAFKVFVGKDIKGTGSEGKADLLYIDVSDIIKSTNGNYSYRNQDVDILISYLIAGMNAKIYHADPSKISNRNVLIDSGSKSFMIMINYLVDRLRIGSVPFIKEKIGYLSAMYFQINILGKDRNSEAIHNRAVRLSSISEKDATLIKILLEKIDDPYKDVNTFTNAMATVINAPKFTVDVLVESWIKYFSPGTQFGLELYPSFANILIYTYIGAYLVNQKTIENLIKQELVIFVTEILKLGSELL